MGRMYVASVLMSISGKTRPAEVAETELKPMTPGAWAAWARDWDEQRSGQTDLPTAAPAPSTTSSTLQPSGSNA
jgi:hypothetical protein